MDHDHHQLVVELAEQHGRMVFTTAYRILGNADDAEDALQEVFLKVLACGRDRRRVEVVKEWGAYLRVVATRVAVGLLRDRLRRHERYGRLPEDVADPSCEDPDARAWRQQRAAILRRGISSLNGRDAQVFILRHFESFSYEEIASQMGLSVSQVGVILHRVRNRLQSLLQPAVNPGMADDGADVARLRLP